MPAELFLVAIQEFIPNIIILNFFPTRNNFEKGRRITLANFSIYTIKFSNQESVLEP